MATRVLSNAYLLIASVDLSAHGVSVRVNYEADAVEDSAFGDATRNFIAGVKRWSAEVEFNGDDAAGAVSATLFSLVGTSVAIEFRPDTGAVAVGNPKYTGSAILTSFPPLGGGYGDLNKQSCSLQGTGTLTRATS